MNTFWKRQICRLCQFGSKRASKQILKENKCFYLKDPQDTAEIGRLVNLIVAQNGIADANHISEGDQLMLRL